jgi:hypothetical protein
MSLLDNLQKVGNWIKTVYSEPNGNGSVTRILMQQIIAFILGVGIAFAVMTHQNKITMEQFNTFLGSGGTFIVTTCGAIYGVNKLADWAKNRDNKNGEQ